MKSMHPAILGLTVLLAGAVGCTFEARGKAGARGSTTSGGEPAAEPTEPGPAADARAEEQAERRRARRQRRRRRHRARRVPPPEGPPQKTAFGSTKPEKKALQGNIYFLPEDTKRLPDFESLDPVGTVYSKKIDVPERRFDEGFPGISDRFEWFGVVYSGTFRVRRTGEHEFRLVSDDGSKLWIDGELVVDNDGTHPPKSKSGTIELERGEHDIVVEYFQGPRYHIALQLFVTPPEKKEKILKIK